MVRLAHESTSCRLFSCADTSANSLTRPSREPNCTLHKIIQMVFLPLKQAHREVETQGLKLPRTVRRPWVIRLGVANLKA